MRDEEFTAATRRSYDRVAEDYAEWIRPELAAKPMDRAVLASFAELVRAEPNTQVLDVGCGPGRITAYLRQLGLEASGIDLAPGMVAIARREHPGLSFAEGSMTRLELAAGSLGGLVAWYSVIHLPAEWRPTAFAEFHRVLRTGGWLQLAFQVGTETMRMTSVGQHEVELDFHRLDPDVLSEELSAAGFEVRVRTWRAADVRGDFPESAPQGFLLARRRGSDLETAQFGPQR